MIALRLKVSKIGNNNRVCEQDRATVETDLSGYADRNTDLERLPPEFVDTASRRQYQLGSGLFICQ